MGESCLLPRIYDGSAVTSPALAPSNVSATGLVIRRGTRIGQGENTFDNRKIELGVRRCMVGGSDRSKRAAAPDRGGRFLVTVAIVR